jgi:hypothetical protein
MVPAVTGASQCGHGDAICAFGVSQGLVGPLRELHRVAEQEDERVRVGDDPSREL